MESVQQQKVWSKEKTRFYGYQKESLPSEILRMIMKDHTDVSGQKYRVGKRILVLLSILHILSISFWKIHQFLGSKLKINNLFIWHNGEQCGSWWEDKKEIEDISREWDFHLLMMKNPPLDYGDNILEM